MGLLNVLRLEKGFIHNHHDVTPHDTPFEAGLGWTIDFSKDTFCGKDALLKMKATPLTHRLVNFTVDAPIGLWGGETELIIRDDIIVGAITSAGYSHHLQKAIGLASIKVPEGSGTIKKRIETGSYKVRAPVNGEIKDFPCQISLKCFVDPKGDRLKTPLEK